MLAIHDDCDARQFNPPAEKADLRSYRLCCNLMQEKMLACYGRVGRRATHAINPAEASPALHFPDCVRLFTASITPAST